MRKIIQAVLSFSMLVFHLNAVAQKVGIGTNNPQSNLHVAGTARTDSGFVAMPFSNSDALTVKGYHRITSIDQQNNAANNPYTGLADAWQSFTCGITGTLDSISLKLGQPLMPGLKLYAGEGTGGALLADVPGTISHMYALPHITVTAGQKYTIYLSNARSWYFGGSNPYPNGQSSVAGSDFTFKTFVQTENESLFDGVRVNRNGNLDVADSLTTGNLLVKGATFLNSLSVGVLTLSTPGGTATPLDYYEEAQVFSSFSNGANTYWSNYTALVVRTGKQVTLTFPLNVLPITATGVQDILFGGIPERFRPANNLYFTILVRNGGTDQVGLAVVHTDGTVWFKPGTGGGTWIGANSGLYAFSISYVLYD